MSRFLTSNTYVSPTKEQIKTALAKVERIYEIYKPIVLRLTVEEVEVSFWWGLKKKIMTKDQHIRKENDSSLVPYYTRAFALGYVNEEELKICEFIMHVPGLRTLKEWAAAEQVFLGEWDHVELMYALSEEI